MRWSALWRFTVELNVAPSYQIGVSRIIPGSPGVLRTIHLRFGFVMRNAKYTEFGIIRWGCEAVLSGKHNKNQGSKLVSCVLEQATKVGQQGQTIQPFNTYQRATWEPGHAQHEQHE